MRTIKATFLAVVVAGVFFLSASMQHTLPPTSQRLPRVWAPFDRYTLPDDLPTPLPPVPHPRPAKRPLSQASRLPPGAELILAAPLDLADATLRNKCTATFSDFPRNEEYLRRFTKLFKRLRVHWWLDEGGLIGAARAGSMSNADDDFDFFALLPNQIHPCSPSSHTCTPEQFNRMIHAFLMEFWKDGFCVNNFDPDLSKFNSSSKLMYSLMLNRDRVYQPHAKTPGARCFEHSTRPRFAHMHLAMLTPKGELATNVWAPPKRGGRGHAHDKIPLKVVLPVTRCRAGAQDAPCPNDIETFLKLRNEGEYNKSSSQGNCLLVRKGWSAAKKQETIDTVKRLHKCGYNSMYGMVDRAVASDYLSC